MVYIPVQVQFQISRELKPSRGNIDFTLFFSRLLFPDRIFIFFFSFFFHFCFVFTVYDCVTLVSGIFFRERNRRRIIVSFCTDSLRIKFSCYCYWEIRFTWLGEYQNQLEDKRQRIKEQYYKERQFYHSALYRRMNTQSKCQLLFTNINIMRD